MATRLLVALSAVAAIALAGCTTDDARSPEARACDKVLSLPDRDVTGELESDVLRRQLDDWRMVWEHAKDAAPDIREPVRKIVDDYARAVDGRSTTAIRQAQIYLTAEGLGLTCLQVLISTSTTEG